MRKVGAFEAKTHLAQLLTEVERDGAEIIIQRRGKDVAALVPCHELPSLSAGQRKAFVLGQLRAIHAAQAGRKPRRRLTPEELIEEGRER